MRSTPSPASANPLVAAVASWLSGVREPRRSLMVKRCPTLSVVCDQGRTPPLTIVTGDSMTVSPFATPIPIAAALPNEPAQRHSGATAQSNTAILSTRLSVSSKG